MENSKRRIVLRDRRDAAEFVEVLPPTGTRHIICVGRMCGDFHADVEGHGFHVCAIGDTPKAAVLAAIAKVLA
jgi:hypothetical protein